MHAVQVMKFLKTLIQKVLRERQESAASEPYGSHSGPSDENPNNHVPLSFCFNATDRNNKDPNEATATNKEHVLLKKNKKRRMMMIKMKKSCGTDPLSLDLRKISNNEIICTTTIGRINTTRLEREDAWR